MHYKRKIESSEDCYSTVTQLLTREGELMRCVNGNRKESLRESTLEALKFADSYHLNLKSVSFQK